MMPQTELRMCRDGGAASLRDHRCHSSISLEMLTQRGKAASQANTGKPPQPGIPIFCMEASLTCLFEMEDLRAEGREAQ